MNNTDIYAAVRKEIRTLLSPTDLALIICLASKVEHGLILETGVCFGGSTAAMALASTTSVIVAIDSFVWQPANEATYGALPKNTPMNVRQRWNNLGIPASQIILLVADSGFIGPRWTGDIDFLFIDGGHSYEEARSDLQFFGTKARVIAIHDYMNVHLPQIKQAVEDFLSTNPGYVLSNVHGTGIAILHRRGEKIEGFNVWA